MRKLRNVVVVDEDARFQQQLAENGQVFGFQMQPATGRRDALQAVYRGCDLVIINREFQEGMGLELFGMLRQVRPFIPVILTSNEIDFTVQAEMYQANAELYLPKPVDYSRLAEAIVSLLNFAAARRASAEAGVGPYMGLAVGY